MSNARYLEIDSTYRNRNEWPDAGDFVVPISQTGRKGPLDAVDPISDSAAETTWVANAFTANAAGAVINLTVLALAPGTATGTTTLIVSAPPGEIQTLSNYYSFAILTFAGPPALRLRVASTRFLGTDGTVDRMQVTVTGAVSIPLGSAVTIEDPSDLTAVLNPLLFVPAGKIAPNSYPGTVVHNQTLNQTRPTEEYFAFTHLIKLDTSGSAIATDTSGPVTGWLLSHTYAIRPLPAMLCTTLDGLAIPNPTTHTAFNLALADSRPNLNGSFLEVEYAREPATGTAALAAVASNTTVNLAAAASQVDDFYIGCTIRISASATVAGQIQTITAYTGATRTAVVAPGFTGLPAAGDTYQIICPQTSRRIVKYVDYRDAAVGGTLTSIDFPASASDSSGFYNNLYIRVGADLRLIQNYVVTRNGAGNIISRTATVFIAFAAVPVLGTLFTITSGMVDPPFPFSLAQQPVCLLQFSRDNLNPFVYTGSLVSQQDVVCYEIELLNLVLPNATLAVAGGGLISFYPYVYVQIRNIDASGGGLKNVIYSNNPHATNMLFRAAIDDVPNPVNSTFIKIDGDGAVQTIKFKPNDNLRFSVHMSNGEIYKTTLVEGFSPHMPNPFAQISALFSIKRV